VASRTEPRPEPELEHRNVDPKRANLLYHDAAAPTYDRKWAISFDRRSIRYVADRARWMLPRPRYRRVLEVGCGTGFFLLNMWQAGLVEEAHACDISPGMLAACAENARRIGCDIRLRTADAESLPYADGSFDLVVGHAFLHHIPEPDLALLEMRRVLAPGGAILVAGEPTRAGDRLARTAGRLTYRAVRQLARLVPALRPPDGPTAPSSDAERLLAELEWRVDLHTFDLSRVEAMAREAGFESVRLETEELASSLFGWAVRTVESQARPGTLGPWWGRFAYRGYLALYAVDRLVLYRMIPKGVFHHFLLYGEKRG
jgi:ubiquinone/menaquinone biosynthesis C-methylase UbiE